MQYDVIMVGARVAGSATALLLARRGLRVLVVDRATFPSDTLSTHQVHVTGVARLARWGVLDRIVAAGTPATRSMRLTLGQTTLAGRVPEYDGVNASYGPRRTLLDAVLVAAAREAGAEVRENFIVESLVEVDGAVAGITGLQKGGPIVTERATLVVGADGRRSTVAKVTGARSYREIPPRTMAWYGYFADVPLSGGEMFAQPHRSVGLWPTNDGLTMAYIAWPRAQFSEFRSDPEANFLATLDQAGLGGRFRAGRRVERLRGTPDLPSFFRQPYGPGWALVGDAGLVLDPITACGISDALRDAELLSQSIVAGLGGERRLSQAMADYHRARDRAALPMYRMTAQLAALSPQSRAEARLMAVIADTPGASDELFAVLTGALPVQRLMSPGRLVHLVGVRGVAQLLAAQLRSSRVAAAADQQVTALLSA